MGNKFLSLQRGILKHQKARFALVGIVNTIVDFGLLFLLTFVVLQLAVVEANIISTSCALAVSYMLNKKAVFGNTDSHNLRQILLFVGGTLFGLWVLQNLVITGVIDFIWTISDLDKLSNLGVALFAAKVVATIVSLVWNYLWYSRVVFRKDGV